MSSGKASEFDLQSNVVRLSVVIRIVNVKLIAGGIAGRCDVLFAGRG